MGFIINLGAWNSIFAVPSDVVDKHIRLAGENQLKVLLILLRLNSVAVSAEKIADMLKIDKEDVVDAVQYWIDNKIIKKVDEEYVPATDKKAVTESKVSDNPTTLNRAKKRRARALSRPLLPDSTHLSKRMQESEEIGFLMQEAQGILGKTLSNGDSAVLLMLHDTDGLPVEVIIMLLQYTVMINKASIRYIEKVGIAWAEEGINSIELAEKKIKSMTERNNAFNVVRKIIGVDNHSPTAKELDFCNRWINEWGFDKVMIREAYERSIDTIGKLSYNYINGILQNWYKKHIFHVKDIEPLEKKTEKNIPKTSKKKSGSVLQNFSSKATYDLEEFSKKSIFDD